MHVVSRHLRRKNADDRFLKEINERALKAASRRHSSGHSRVKLDICKGFLHYKVIEK